MASTSGSACSLHWCSLILRDGASLRNNRFTLKTLKSQLRNNSISIAKDARICLIVCNEVFIHNNAQFLYINNSNYAINVAILRSPREEKHVKKRFYDISILSTVWQWFFCNGGKGRQRGMWRSAWAVEPLDRLLTTVDSCWHRRP